MIEMTTPRLCNSPSRRRALAICTSVFVTVPWEEARSVSSKRKNIRDKKTYTVDFQAYISSDVTGKLQSIAAGVANDAPGSELYIIISGPGGDPTSAAGTYAFLRSLPLKIVTVAAAQVASASVAMYLAGDRRIVTDLSSFLFHAPFVFVEEADVTADDIRENISQLADIRETTSKIYAERMKISFAAASELQASQKIFRGQAAVEAGIATEYQPIFKNPSDVTITITDALKSKQ